jgi:phosphatidate phosphatase PAH1
MSPKSFAEAMIDAMSDPSSVKANTIKAILKLFDIKENAVVGAYGNRNSDTKAYLEAGIPSNLIFLVNPESILRRVSDGKRTSYFQHATNVSSMYPKID